VIGFISNASKTNVVRDLLAMICGSLIIYAFGVWWLNKLTGMTLGKTLAVGMYPFLPGDALKMAVAIPIAKALRPVIKKE
jgi:biotin transport system substrate-specific component